MRMHAFSSPVQKRICDSFREPPCPSERDRGEWRSSPRSAGIICTSGYGPSSPGDAGSSAAWPGRNQARTDSLRLRFGAAGLGFRFGCLGRRGLRRVIAAHGTPGIAWPFVGDGAERALIGIGGCIVLAPSSSASLLCAPRGRRAKVISSATGAEDSTSTAAAKLMRARTVLSPSGGLFRRIFR